MHKRVFMNGVIIDQGTMSMISVTLGLFSVSPDHAGM
jgi:hypothetical protein